MQKCKINKTTCLGYNKRTEECCGIENCKHKVEHMDKKEAIKIAKRIKEECNNNEICCYCAFCVTDEYWGDLCLAKSMLITSEGLSEDKNFIIRKGE